jgi:hypothetical protein
MSLRTSIAALFTAGAIAAVVAVGSASTESNSLPAANVSLGYASQTITGVAATAVTYNQNVSGDTITSVGLVLDGDTTARTISIAFNDAAPATCSDTGSFATASTTYTCAVSQPVSGAAKFALISS